ncbi:MAG: hypothetical protein H6838_02815 [Planctomycetes bacterium]|nr:hypothetical protein [Planctomycetota bacterium]MCB9884392.1 hypothetical protein [Planctomycetota bacterium]
MRHASHLARSAALSLLLLLASGCVWNRHEVGLGATGTGETSERQFYMLFGLIEINEVDTRRMAPELTSYTIETEFGFVDLLLTPLLLLTITSRTVVVRT